MIWGALPWLLTLVAAANAFWNSVPLSGEELVLIPVA